MKKNLMILISSIFLFSCSQDPVNQNLVPQNDSPTNAQAQAQAEKNGLISYDGYVAKDSKGNLFLGINRTLLGASLDSKEKNEWHDIDMLFREFKDKNGSRDTQAKSGDAKFGKNSKLYYSGYDSSNGKDQFYEIGTYKATLPLKENAKVKISLAKGLTFKTRHGIQLGGGPVPTGPYIESNIDLNSLVKTISEKDLY